MKRKEPINALAVGSAQNLLGRVAGRGLQMGAQIVIARYLGPAAFGVYALANTVMRIAGLVSPLGLDRGVTHFAAGRAQEDRGAATTAVAAGLLLSAVSGVAVGILLAAGATTLADRLFHDPAMRAPILIAAAGVPFLSLLRVAAAATRIRGNMRAGVFAEDFVQPASFLLMVVTVCAYGGNADAFVVVTILSFAFAAVVALRFVTRSMSIATVRLSALTARAPELLRFSAPASLGAVATMLILWVDRLMVGTLDGVEAAGAYQAASQIALVFTILVNATANVLAPLSVELRSGDKVAELTNVFRASIRWPLVLGLPAMLPCIVFPEAILELLYGAQYATREGAALAFSILVLGQLGNVATGSVGILLILRGYQTLWMRAALAMLAVAVMLNAVLIGYWGIVGAAIATSASLTGLFLIGVVLVGRKLGVWAYDRSFLPLAVATSIAAAALGLLRVTGFASELFQVAMICGVMLPIYAFGLWRYGLQDDDRTMISARLSTARTD